MDSKARITCTLSAEGWNNIFHVLKWCAPMKLSISEEAYLDRFGDHFSLGAFWAQVQHLQGQVERAEAMDRWLQSTGQRVYAPLPEDHHAIGDRCGLCRFGFAVGDVTTLEAVAPASAADEVKQQAGLAYTATAALVHASCALAKWETTQKREERR